MLDEVAETLPPIELDREMIRAEVERLTLRVEHHVRCARVCTDVDALYQMKARIDTLANTVHYAWQGARKRRATSVIPS